MIEVMLGGIAISPHASGGFPQQEYRQVPDGVTEDTRSGGSLVKMVHFRKTIITISGAGLMGHGFEGLNFDEPLELLCTAPKSLRTAGTTGVIPGSIRQDNAPWAYARIERRQVPTPVTMAGNAFTLTPVPGATDYTVLWMPRFMVSCELPDEAIQRSEFPYAWSFDAREV